MDPLSITAACMALTATITKTSISVTNFVRSVRAARSDLDAISRELASLKTLLELIAEDAEDINTFPETLRKHIAGILANCELVLIEVQRLVEKYAEPGVIKGSKWALAGSEDVAKLRMSLEAHKSALEIALEMVTLFMTREIKTNTSNLRHDTAAIKQDTTNILQEIARLRAQLPDDLATLRPSTQGPDSMLIHYLDDLTSYAETVCWSGEDSDTDTEGADDSNTHHSLRNKQKLSHKRTPSPTDTETVTMGARNPLQGLQAPSHVAQNTHLPIHTVRTASPRLGADETIHAEDQESKVILKPHHVREERPKVLQQSTSWVPGHVTSRSDDFSASNISGAKLDGVSKGERASLMLAKELAAQEQEQAKMRARRARQATERQQRVVSHASPPRNTLISSQGTWTLGKTSALESQGKLKFATNEMTREIVAVKMYARDEHQEVSIAREAALLSLVTHPNITLLRDVVRTQYYCYLLVQLGGHKTLFEYIKAHVRVEEEQARKFARQIGSALAYCHAHLILHQSLRVHKIIISKSGDIKITGLRLSKLDYGFSDGFSYKAVGSSMSNEREPNVYLRPLMMSESTPTLWDTGVRKDVRSFGIVLWTMLCGSSPVETNGTEISDTKMRGLMYFSADAHSLLHGLLSKGYSATMSLDQALSSRWMTYGYGCVPDNHTPAREPLTLPLDRKVVDRMTGFDFDFGSSENIKHMLTTIINSGEYQNASATWHSLQELHAPKEQNRTTRRSLFSIFVQKLKSPKQDAKPKEGVKVPSDFSTHLQKFTIAPAVPIYYLTREKLERERKREQLQGKKPKT